MPPSFATLSASKCIATGAASLTQREQQAIANLFRDETRKGAFLIAGRRPLERFCEHVLREFPEQHTTNVVYDYLPYLRRRATLAARTRRFPLVALVLYATWLEHWTNMVITVGMLRRGTEQGDIDAFFQSRPRFEEKLRRCGPPLALPSLPKDSRDWALKLIRLRNEFIHYTWQGTPIRVAATRHGNIRSAVRHARQHLDALRAWEFTALDAPNVKAIQGLLPKARWKRPEAR